MRDNITSNYKKEDTNMERNINLEAKKTTQKLKISDQVEKLSCKNAYITVKDHKPNFHIKVACRLINPTKSNRGKKFANKLWTELIIQLDIKPN